VVLSGVVEEDFGKVKRSFERGNFGGVVARGWRTVEEASGADIGESVEA